MTEAPRWQANILNRSALFAPLAPYAAALCQHRTWPTRDDYNALLTTHAIQNANGQGIRCVAQGTRPTQPEQRYEARIFLSGELQTRTANWHDFFNVLVWLAFPRTKARLNALHYSLAQAQPLKTNRTRAQDVLTLFDEGGIVVASRNAALLELVRQFRWKELFWQQRAAVLRDLRFYLFGHALYEKALAPYPGLTAKGVLLEVDDAFLAQPLTAQIATIDSRIAHDFADAAALQSTRMLAPVPLLGYPGWDARNATADYYDNSAYFRSGYTRLPRVHKA